MTDVSRSETTETPTSVQLILDQLNVLRRDLELGALGQVLAS